MTRPLNVVILGFDSLRADVPAAVVGGVAVMPTLAGLAARSVDLRSCHAVSPTCIPSRVGFVSGRYPFHGSHRTSTTTLRSSEPDLITYLRQSGFTTALVGLNHMATPEVLDRMFGVRRSVEPTPGTGAELYDGALPLAADDWDQVRITAAAEAVLADLARETPFLLMVNWFLPHPPYRVPRSSHGVIPRGSIEIAPPPPSTGVWESRAALAQRGVREGAVDPVEMRGTYLDACRFLDGQVERVLGCLERLALVDDTIVLCWSDHGDLAGDRGLGEKWITGLLDSVTRIPVVLSVPGWTAAAPEGLVEAIDLLPTVIEAAGLKVPAWVNGESFAGRLEQPLRSHVRCDAGLEPALAQQLAQVASKRAGWKYRVVEGAPATVLKAASLRTKTHKLVARLGGSWELYELEADPNETVNLVDDPAEAGTRSQLTQRLVESWLDSSDRAPTPERDELVL